MSGRPALEFGAIVDSRLSGAEGATAFVGRAEELGFDFFCVYDHPYWTHTLDAWVLITTLLSRTERIRGLSNVLNVPLRGNPAMLAKQAASLDILSGGRLEIGLGAGALPVGISSLGGHARTPVAAVEALGEVIEIMRLFWGQREGKVVFHGRHYSIDGADPGPVPAHPISIGLGVYRPSMLKLVGRLADAWLPSLVFASPEDVPSMQREIDSAALEAGRDPAQIRRMYNLAGEITDGPARGLLHGPAQHWIDELTRFVIELGFDTFHFGYEVYDGRQFERFALDVIPGVREQVASTRR